MAEQLIRNEQVVSSILTTSSKNREHNDFVMRSVFLMKIIIHFFLS